MSKPVNAFFKLHVSGKLADRTPVRIASGILHCVELGTSNRFLPVAYYDEPLITISSVNSLLNPRSDEFCYTTMLMEPDEDVDRLKIITSFFSLTWPKNGKLAVDTPQHTAVEFVDFDLTFIKLALNYGEKENVSSFNEVDSDVVLTTGSTTAWNRPKPTGPDIVVKSNVLDLIYAALFAEGNATSSDTTSKLDTYAILANREDMATDETSATRFFNFTDQPFVQSTGKFTFSNENPMTRKAVDKLLDGVTGRTDTLNMLQRNDTLDITVSGIDANANQLYTTTLLYNGGEDSSVGNEEEYPSTLFPGLLESNPTAYANKQAVCIAVAKYNGGRGLNTVSFPPFQFVYKRCDQFKVLDEVKLDFVQYYYIVYQFAPLLQVTPLRLFSRSTKNQVALRDVIVLSGKRDAYVDLKFPSPDYYSTDNRTSTFTSLSVSFKAGATDVPAPTCTTTPGRATGQFQFFTHESDLYTGRTATDEPTGAPKMRLYLGLVDPSVTTIRISATTRTKTWTVTIPKTNIRNYKDSVANAGLVELQYPGRVDLGNRSTFNDDISQWDIQAGVDASGLSFDGLLKDLTVFNQPLGCWNTAGITSFESMFAGAKAFDQPIGAWSTSAVSSMASMFDGASRFSQSLTRWDVRSVSSFNEMFHDAGSFNGDVSGWQTRGASAVGMFEGAVSFNQPLVAGFVVTDATRMFKGASSFNQPWIHLLSGYTGTSLDEMFCGATSLSCVPSFSHALPVSCTTAVSMFEGASRWNGSVTSTTGALLASAERMYRNATAFNRSVSLSAGPNFDATRIFEGALSMNSAVAISGPGPYEVTLEYAFLNATAFNNDVTIQGGKIRSARSLFKNASAYGGDDDAVAKPSLGAVQPGSRACNLTFADDASGSAAVGPAVGMFEGTRFDNVVHGRAPRDASYMFEGAAYFNTPLAAGFISRHVTSLEGMFKGASRLVVNPIPDASGLVNVANLSHMFEDATRFNADIAQWGAYLPAYADYNRMFWNATSFNQNLPLTWKKPASDITDMFKHATAYGYGALQNLSTASPSVDQIEGVKVILTMSGDYSDLVSDSAKLASFKDDFVQAVATTAGVDVKDVHITSIGSGSVVVSFVIATATDASGAAGAAGAAGASGAAVASGAADASGASGRVIDTSQFRNFAFGSYQVTKVTTFPTGVRAVLTVAGVSTTNFAAGHTYTDAVVLSLLNVDDTPVDPFVVAETGAVHVLVDGTLVPGVVESYTYDPSTRTVRIHTMRLGVQVGALQFGVTVTAPESQSSFEVRSSGHAVVAMPDTVTIAPIADGEYSLVASHAIATRFTFSHTNRAIQDKIRDLASGVSAASVVTVVGTTTVTLDPTFGGNRVIGANVSATAEQEHAFTFTFASTRTTAACVVASTRIYTFPTQATCVVAFDGSGSDVPLEGAATLTWTTDASGYLPISTVHSTSGSDATYTAVTTTPTDARTSTVVYMMSPTAKTNLMCALTLSFGGVSVEYPAQHALTEEQIRATDVQLATAVAKDVSGVVNDVNDSYRNLQRIEVRKLQNALVKCNSAEKMAAYIKPDDDNMSSEEYAVFHARALVESMVQDASGASERQQSSTLDAQFALLCAWNDALDAFAKLRIAIGTGESATVVDVAQALVDAAKADVERLARSSVFRLATS